MDRDRPNEDAAESDDAQSAHPTEPAEGARDPGQDTGEDRAVHPSDPAEGPREAE